MINRRFVLKGIALSALGGWSFADRGFATSQGKVATGKETKIFDPADGFAPLTDPLILTDATLAKRGNRWWMYLAGRAKNRAGIQLFSASLPEGAPLAATGWTLTADDNDKTKIANLAGQDISKAWDLAEGGTVRLMFGVGSSTPGMVERITTRVGR